MKRTVRQLLLSNQVLPPYLGQVATHCFTASQLGTTQKQSMSRTRHVMMTDVSSFQVVFPNWQNREQPVSVAGTITAGIEYPVGVFTQVTWSASPTGTIPDGSYLVSDPISLFIPSGAIFFVRAYYTNTVGVLTLDRAIKTGLGEACTFAVSGVVDQTMGGTVTNTAANISYGPIAIIGNTTKPSFALMGDSRVVGFGDFMNIGATNAAGEFARSFDDSWAYTNLGISSSLLSEITASSKRVALAGYCSHILSDFGINDIATKTGAQVVSDLQTLRGYFGSKPFIQSTISPRTTSTDSWATTVNQTPDSREAQRLSLNSAIRSLPGGFSGYLEIADQVETARDSGIWRAPGYTTDGLHETATANTAIFNSGAIVPAQLAKIRR